MIVGFTGTRNGMSLSQKLAFAELCTDPCTYPFSLFVHGDCKGADADAHMIAYEYEKPIEIRPCDFPNSRAFCPNARTVHPVATAFARNRAIVDVCDLLIACPPIHDWQSLKRGGTVYTIRYAVKVERKVLVLLPLGGIETL